MKALRLEPGVTAGPALLGDLSGAIAASALRHGTPRSAWGGGWRDRSRRR